MNAPVSPAAIQKEFLLASMRAAVANMRTWQLEIEMIGVALRGGLLSLEDAYHWLADIGLLEGLPPINKTESPDGN